MNPKVTKSKLTKLHSLPAPASPKKFENNYSVPPRVYVSILHKKHVGLRFENGFTTRRAPHKRVDKPSN